MFPLEAENAQEEQIVAEGQKHKVQRLMEAKESLLETPPTPEEQQYIHKLFVNTLDRRCVPYGVFYCVKGLLCETFIKCMLAFIQLKVISKQSFTTR